MLKWFLWHDEIFVTEANLVFAERKVVAILRVFFHGLFARADSPIIPFLLFGGRLNGVFIVFGTVQSVILFCDGIAVFYYGVA